MPDVVKEKISPPIIERNLKFQHKDVAFLDTNRDFKKNSTRERVIQSKFSDNSLSNDDELVKHMSNLPGFLQKAEKKISVQEKALNFGVLDWKSLEKWKYNERMPAKCHKKSSSISSIGAPKMAPNMIKQKNPSSSISSEKQPVSHFLRLSPSPHGKPSSTKYPKQEIIPEKESSPRDKIEFTPQIESSPRYKIESRGKRSEMRFEDETNNNSEFFPRSSFSGSSPHFTDSRTSIDGQLAEAYLGNKFSQELYSGEFSSDIPHSCPLFSQSIDVNNTTPTLSKDKFQAGREKSQRGSFSFSESTAKGRHASPIRRLSFSLGKMGRSFSFKESASENSPNTDNFDMEKTNPTTRGRSSPLRRLLDPFMKHKENLKSQEMKPIKVSNFRALLQISFKNGLPFYKLVVDNSTDMLAAVMKRNPLSEKSSDGGMSYVFYSVHEIKKKSTKWMSPGSKGNKSGGLGYNVVGNMTISNSYLMDRCVARECVLYGVDMDKETHEVLGNNKEVAAFVVKNSIEKRYNGENGNFDGIRVILPGGVHGVPIRGAFSSLISRWRSGGVCDCGGWDVGCKLRVLMNSEMSADRVSLFSQGVRNSIKPVFRLEPFRDGIYSIEWDASISLLEAFATCVAFITCHKFPEILDTNVLSGIERSLDTGMGSDNTRNSTTRLVQVPAKYVTSPPTSPYGRI